MSDEIFALLITAMFVLGLVALVPFLEGTKKVCQRGRRRRPMRAAERSADEEERGEDSKAA